MSTERITLWNCHKFTDLEIVQQVKSDLLKQRVKSEIGGFSCQYTAFINGQTVHCGIGWMIPQDEYRQSLEGFVAGDLIYHLGLSSFFSDDRIALLEELQRVHDDYEPNEWEFQFGEIERKLAA